MRRSWGFRIGVLLGALLLGTGTLAAGLWLAADDDGLRERLVIVDDADVVIDGGHFTSTEGSCIEIRNAERVTISNAEIGPCAGQGITILRSENITIVDSYIHPEFPVTECCDRGDGILAQLVTDLTIHGNVFAFGETNIELMSVSGARVVGNFLLNPLGPFPRGQQVQLGRFGDNPPSRDVLIEGNYAIAETTEQRFAARQEDAFNIGSAEGVRVIDNYIVGGQSASGCGIIADREASAVWVEGNFLHETANCGIGITTGFGNRVIDNRVLNTHEIGGSSAIYIWDIYGDRACDDVVIADNITFSMNTGYVVDLGGCTNVDVQSHVSGEQARALLTPFKERFPPPSIPPRPYERVVQTPFTTEEP